ncbi:protamine-like protein 99C [Drosophila biarmipes]|uniref:protamine-like protein 99C n=1 Tax=Drosophila biarmipes TaxID=125945 RepID=UPI0021CC519F|nr:protamine-like protein 99C [Drosophila biarmipes]
MAGKKRGTALCKPKYKFQKVARVTNNGYLNFLTEYKKRFCGVSPRDMVRFGARRWNQLTLQEKALFKNMKEPVSDIRSAPQELESQALGESPGKSERGKRSPVRSPSSRQGKSKIKKAGSGSIKRQMKKNPSPVARNGDPNILGSAIAFINFMRKLQRRNKDCQFNDLFKKGTRLWCRMHGNQRKQFESPLWIVRT